MHSDHAGVNFAPLAIPLPGDTHGLVAAFADRRLVHHADRVGVSVVLGHDLLATVMELLFIPLDRFQETL